MEGSCLSTPPLIPFFLCPFYPCVSLVRESFLVACPNSHLNRPPDRSFWLAGMLLIAVEIRYERGVKEH